MKTNKSVWVLFALLVILGAVALQLSGKNVDYPEVVYADADGVWSATIKVTGVEGNPDFQIVTQSNTVIPSVQVVSLGGGSWEIRLGGQLVNPGRDGSFTFRVDPEDTVVEATVTIASGAIPTPLGVPPWSLYALGLLVVIGLGYLLLMVL